MTLSVSFWICNGTCYNCHELSWELRFTNSQSNLPRGSSESFWKHWLFNKTLTSQCPIHISTDSMYIHENNGTYFYNNLHEKNLKSSIFTTIFIQILLSLHHGHISRQTHALVTSRKPSQIYAALSVVFPKYARCPYC